MSNQDAPLSPKGLICLGVMASFSIAILGLPILTEWAAPIFYRSNLSLASPPKIESVSQAVSVESMSAVDAIKAIALARPALVALDPELWVSQGVENLTHMLEALTGIPTVVGLPSVRRNSFESQVLNDEFPASMPRLPTLEGTLLSPKLIRLALDDAFTLPNFSDNVTTALVWNSPSPTYQMGLAARSISGLMMSLPFETLRRFRGVAPTQIAYVEGLGILVGKQFNWPVSNEAQSSLRLIHKPAMNLNNTDIGELKKVLSGKIVFVGSANHRIQTVLGSRLTVETWASAVDEALAKVTPKPASNFTVLISILSLIAVVALGMVFFFGVGPLGLALWTSSLAMVFLVASFLTFAIASIWLPVERPFFALLGAGFIALIWRILDKPKPLKAVVPKHTTSIPVIQPAPRATSRIQKQPSSGADTGIERDAQGGLLRLNRYRILRKMGAGSAGEVYEGVDTQMSRRVAVKTMTRGAALHFDHALERFHVEAKAAGSLNHPNINTIYDSGSAHEVSYMVLEYLDGITLAQWMKAHIPTPPVPSSVREWVRQIASALDYAHSHRIIHRDLKPSNLMVVDEGRTIKLLDFGVAKVEDVMLTQAGMTVGTPSYMSPEQLQGEKVSAASDQYSLAVVLYQLFSYKLPYAGTRIPEICGRILKNEIIPLHNANPYLDEAHWWVLQRAMRRDPVDRYPNCTALFEALELIWTRDTSK